MKPSTGLSQPTPSKEEPSPIANIPVHTMSEAGTKGVSKIESFEAIVKEYNGLLWTIDLGSVRRTSVESNLMIDDSKYRLTKPLFLGQMPFSKDPEKDTADRRGKEIALLYNRMIEAYTRKKGEFVFYIDNGQMVNKFNISSVQACVFLFKADEAFILPQGNDDATDFLVNLYDNYFLVQYLTNDTVALMQFSSAFKRDQAKEAICDAERVNKGICPYPVVIERAKEKIPPESMNQLFVRHNHRWLPVGGGASGLNFTQAYSRSEIDSYTFCVSTEEKLALENKKELFEQRGRHSTHFFARTNQAQNNTMHSDQRQCRKRPRYSED